jgi:CcmD family protein
MDMAKWQNLGYLFWAYTCVWGLLAAYLVLMTSRLRRLRHEIDALRRERRDDART